LEGEINKREMHLWFLVFVKFMLVIDIESERIENCRKNGEELGWELSIIVNKMGLILCFFTMKVWL